MDGAKIIPLRMERQCFINKADEAEYIKLYYEPKPMCFVYAIHRNDSIYKAHEHVLKEMAKKLTEGLAYDHEPLQYLLITELGKIQPNKEAQRRGKQMDYYEKWLKSKKPMHFLREVFLILS